MGIDLVRRRDSKKWTCNNALWRFILDSAKCSGWVPQGTEIRGANESNHDPQDYYSNNGQTVNPRDAENLYNSLTKFVDEYKLKGIEKEIIGSFLEWVVRRDKKHSIIDIPGFIIR